MAQTVEKKTSRTYTTQTLEDKKVSFEVYKGLDW